MATEAARRKVTGRGLLIVAALALAVGAALLWWWQRGVAATPPLPAEIGDAEVRQALEAAQRQVLDEPRHAAAWGQYAKVLLAHLFDREARICFAEASRLDPRDPRWLYGQAVIALKRDPDRALGLLEQALAAANKSSWPEYRLLLTLELAEAQLDRANVDEAARLFHDVQAQAPGQPRAALGLGLIEFQRGNLAEAFDYLSTARKSRYARKLAAEQLAALSRAQGDPAEARRYEQEAAAAAGDPPWPDLLRDEVVQLQVGQRGFSRRVTQLEQQHRYAEAARAYVEAAEQRPSVQNYCGAGINYSRLHQDAEALSWLRRAVERWPDSAHAHYSLALALFTPAERAAQADAAAPDTTRFREAVAEARRAAELRPDHAPSYLIWGLALKYLGEPAAAVAPLTRGVACQPNHFELQLALCEMLLATGKADKARTHLENAARLQPADPRLAGLRQRCRSADPPR